MGLWIFVFDLEPPHQTIMTPALKSGNGHCTVAILLPMTNDSKKLILQLRKATLPSKERVFYVLVIYKNNISLISRHPYISFWHFNVSQAE